MAIFIGSLDKVGPQIKGIYPKGTMQIVLTGAGAISATVSISINGGTASSVVFSGNDSVKKLFDMPSSAEYAISLSAISGASASVSFTALQAVLETVSENEVITKSTKPNVALIVGDSILGGGNSNTTVTVTGNGKIGTVTWVGHPVFKGSTFYLAGANEEAVNGTFTCDGVVSNTFTFTAQETLPATATGTITCVFDHRINDRNYLAIANAGAGWPINRIYNRAVTGTTSAQALSRLQKDVLSMYPDENRLVVIQTGTNDIRTDVSLGTTSNNIRRIVELCIDAGCKTILCTVPPGDDATMTATRINNSLLLNDWIRNYVASTNGVKLFDTYANSVSPVSTSNGYITSYSTDRIHPVAFGAQKLGDALKLVLLEEVETGRARFVQSVNDTANVTSTNTQIVTNPLFQGTSGSKAGGAGGTVATGWTATLSGTTPTCTCTVEARADGFGNDQVMVMVSSAANDAIELTSTSSIHSRVSAGDALQMEVQVSMSSITGLKDLEVSLDATLDGLSIFSRAMSTNGQSTGWGTDFDYVFRTLPFTMPSGSLTAVKPRIKATFSAAGGATIKVSRVGIRRR